MKRTGESGPTGLYFIMPVWGEPYIRLFLDAAIPSQLAPGNLPVLREPDHCRYLIFTTPQDAAVITSAAAYRALSDVIPVRIELIEGEPGVPHETMSACFRRGISLADDQGAATVFLTPDLVLSDCAFTTLQRLAGQGWRVVYMTGIRLIKESAAWALRERFLKGGIIAVGSRDLMRIALQHLHPLALSSFWEEEVEYDLLPTNLFWRVESEGILARCFHLHPILVFPQRQYASFRVTIDDDYILASCPDPSRDYVSRDSDELLGVELSGLGRYSPTGMRKGSVADVAFWAELGANSRHRKLIEVPIRLHTGIVDEAAWREAERKSDRVVAEIQSMLNLSWLRLLIASPQTLERRLLLRAQERRCEPKKRTGPAVIKLFAQRLLLRARVRTPSWRVRLADFLLQKRIIPVAVRLFAQRLLLRARVRAPSWRVRLAESLLRSDSLGRYLPGDGRYSPIRLVWSGLGSYPTVVATCFHGLQIIRRMVLGRLGAPSVLNISWLYVRKLSRDVRETLGELGPGLIACDDPDHSTVAQIAAERGGERFGLLIVDDEGAMGNGGARLVDSKTGSLFPDGSVAGVFVDVALRRCEELKNILDEVSRVLKDGGCVAIKVDRLPSLVNLEGRELYLSQSAVCDALRSGFEVIASRRQGRIGTALVVILGRYFKLQIARLRVPLVMQLFLVLARMPLEVALGMILNGLGLLLNMLDATERNYMSCIVLARKTSRRESPSSIAAMGARAARGWSPV